MLQKLLAELEPATAKPTHTQICLTDQVPVPPSVHMRGMTQCAMRLSVTAQ